ncbi:MAG: MerR family transcriptional regulator [Lachnospiraceae bacterium]|nr:MerR family transcriptional regulator [Lachnospiraceae bacterium]
MNEVCKICALTKKAVEYYIAQGLVAPFVQENGYRDFSDEDVERLKKISVLRGLGISTAEIQHLLSEQLETGGALTAERGEFLLTSALKEISDRKRMEIAMMQEKRQLIQELSRTQDWAHVQEKLQRLQNKQSVLERLKNAFPGYYGNYICLHFAPFLSEPIETEEQQEAFETILNFLDHVHFALPADLQAYYCEVTAAHDETIIEMLDTKVKGAYGDIERFLEEHREEIEACMKYKASKEYQSSMAFRLEQALRQFNSVSGYNEIFIPAMCRLSKAYREYHEMLMNANHRFVQEGLYGQTETN